jgi:hypothetical protein
MPFFIIFNCELLQKEIKIKLNITYRTSTFIFKMKINLNIYNFYTTFINISQKYFQNFETLIKHYKLVIFNISI